MDHYERSKLSDAIKEQQFEAEDFIIKEVSVHAATDPVRLVIPFYYRVRQGPSSTWSWRVTPWQPRPSRRVSLLRR
jgi:hypothetical protein